MKSPKKLSPDEQSSPNLSDRDGKPLQNVLLLEYDHRADLFAFAPSACKNQSERVAWLSQALSCAMLGDPASITCLPLIDREQSSVVNPMTQDHPEITLNQEGLLNAFPFLKDIKEDFEAFQPGDNPLLLMLAGVRQSDALDRECQQSLGQPDTAKFAMQCMAEQLNKLKSGFCAFDAYRLTDLVGGKAVIKDEWQTLSVVNQLHHLSRTYPDVHFKVKACMDDTWKFAQSFKRMSLHLDFQNPFIPQGVELYFANRLRAEAATASKASELRPEHHFKFFWSDDVGHGMRGDLPAFSQETIANIYQSMQALLSASDFEKVEKSDLKRDTYTSALEHSCAHILNPEKHQRYEHSVVEDVISNLKLRKTKSSSLDDTGRMRRLDTLAASMNNMVDSLYPVDSGNVTKKNDLYRKRLAIDAFLKDIKASSYDNPNKGVHGVSIRDVQSKVNTLKDKLGLYLETPDSGKRKR